MTDGLEWIEESSNFAICFAIASVVVLVLNTLAPQVQRRSYGQDKVANCIQLWTRLMAQLRVCIVLDTRIRSLRMDLIDPESSTDSPSIPMELFYEKISVKYLDSGDEFSGIYHILAEDTLSFSTDADQVT